MRRAAAWLWNYGVVSNFMTGFFVLLPIIITAAIMGWLGGKLVEWLGPESYIGRGLELGGRQVVSSDWGAAVTHLVGWGIALGGIWALGLFVKTVAKQRLEESFDSLLNHIPIVRAIYKPVAQVVNLLKGGANPEVRAMKVIYCTFGAAQGAGFLALLASKQQFEFAGRTCLAVYLPTSPLPMSGGIIFVPVGEVHDVKMTVDELMQIYFSLGVLAPTVVPAMYQVPTAIVPAAPNNEDMKKGNPSAD